MHKPLWTKKDIYALVSIKLRIICDHVGLYLKYANIHSLIIQPKHDFACMHLLLLLIRNTHACK